MNLPHVCSRRDALRIGSLFGFGLGLGDLLRLQAQDPKPAKAKACILVWLQGGPSTMDMWDLKPNAPSEFRGTFKEIPTNVPGTRISEHLPRCARQMDKM